MKRIIILVLTWSSPGCVSLPAPGVSTRIATAINRSNAAWERIRMSAELSLPVLPGIRQDQVRTALSLGDAALTAARAAPTNEAATAALVQVEKQARVIANPVAPSR